MFADNTCSYLNETLVSLFLQNSVDAEKGITFVSGGGYDEFLSYHELRKKALYVLGNLQELGIQEGDELVLQVEDNRSFLLIFWACLLGRIIPVPLSVSSQEEHLHKVGNVWKLLQNPWIVAHPTHFNKLQHLLLHYQNSRYHSTETLLVQHKPGIVKEVLPGNIAYIQFSSGSTGAPKGVVLTHRNLLYNTKDIIHSSQSCSADSLLSWMPLTHDMGLIGVHLTGIVGNMNQYLMPVELFVRRPLLWMDKVSAYKVTQLYSPDFGYQYFLAAFNRLASGAAWDLSSVRVIYNGAEMIHREVCVEFVNRLRHFGLSATAMVPVYGLAEASVAVSISPVGRDITTVCLERGSVQVGSAVVYAKDASAEGGLTFVDVGFPIQHCALRICNDADEPLDMEYIGHIQLQGANVTSGYFRNKEASDQLFTRDGWLRTGDIGFIRQGSLVMIGRSKTIIIINGNNYYPHDIARIVYGADGIAPGSVAACSIVTPDNREELAVFVVYKNNPDTFGPLAAAIKERLLEHLGIVPGKVIPVKKIPKTTSGKIQYFRLAENYARGLYDEVLQTLQATAGYDTAEDVEAQLATIFRELSGKKVVAGHSFLEQGLNSLQAVRLTLRIAEKCGVEILVTDVFRYTTIQQLAAYIKARKAQNDHKPIEQELITPVAGDGPFDLSYAQRRIWMLNQLTQGSAAHNISLAYSITGPLNLLLLQKALAAIVSRYEILRTSFIVIEGEPRQIIHAEMRMPIVYHDLRCNDNSEQLARSMMARQANLLFALESGPLMKMMVLQTENGHSYLFLVLHHIIADGWSINTIIREIAFLYREYDAGRVPVLPALPIQFRDYLYWQQSLLKRPAMQKHRDYWLQELDYDWQPVQWTISKPSETTRHRKPAGTVGFEWDNATVTALTKTGNKCEATLFSTVTALFYLLLFKHTRDSTIVTGIDTAGRIHAQLEDQVGYFLNTLHLRIDFNMVTDFASLVKLVQQKMLDAFDHQAYPFESLLEDMRLRKGRPMPDLNVLIVFQNFTDTVQPDFGKALQAAYCPVDTNSGWVDLYVELLETAGGIKGFIKYNTDVFAPDAIQMMITHWRYLAEQVIANSEKYIDAYTIVSPAAAQLLLQFNKPARRYAPPSEAHILRLFNQVVHRSPCAVAIISEDRYITYDLLNALSTTLAAAIISKHRVEKEDRIAVLLERTELMVVALLAVVKLGACYVPLDSDVPPERIKFMLADCDAGLLLTDVWSLQEAPSGGLPDLFLIEKDYMSIHPSGNMVTPDRPCDPYALAYIMYTSGSTGKPKGVAVTHASLFDYVRNFSDYFSLNEQDKVIQQASLSFDTSVEEIFPSLCTGATLVILREGGRNVALMTDIIEREQASVVSTVPVIINSLQNFGKRLHSLRVMISGGDRLNERDIRHLPGQIAVYNTYGPTECTVCSTFHKVSDISDASIIGAPVTNRQVYILNEGMEPAPVGFPGEIHLAGQGTARGYINNVELTAEKFIPNPFEPGSLLYRTGDLGKWRADGTITYIGRQDEQVKLNGVRIELAEIETVLSGFDGIQAAVVALVSPHDGPVQLIAYLQTQQSPDIAGLKTQLRQYLPELMVPQRYVFIDDLPRTVSGKVDRRLLLQNYPWNNVPETLFVAPDSTLERQVAAIWQEVLGREKIGLLDNFYECGGDSIKAVQIVLRLHDRGIRVLVKDILICQTIEQLCLQIEQLPDGLAANVHQTIKETSDDGRNEFSVSYFDTLDMDQEDVDRLFE